MKAVSLVDVVVILVPLGRRSFQTFSSRPLPARDSSASGRECLCSKRGVTLSLIAQPEGQTDLSLSYQAREAALAAICAAPHDEPSIAASSVGSERAAAAIALAATLDDEADLSPGETGGSSLAPLHVHEADGLEWPLRLGVLWQQAASA